MGHHEISYRTKISNENHVHVLALPGLKLSCDRIIQESKIMYLYKRWRTSWQPKEIVMETFLQKGWGTRCDWQRYKDLSGYQEYQRLARRKQMMGNSENRSGEGTKEEVRVSPNSNLLSKLAKALGGVILRRVPIRGVEHGCKNVKQLRSRRKRARVMVRPVLTPVRKLKT